MRATGGTRGAGGEAFGSGHLQRCLGSRGNLPSCAPRGAFGAPRPPKGGVLGRDGRGRGGGGDWRRRGGGDFFFSMFAWVHCRVRTHDSAARALPTFANQGAEEAMDCLADVALGLGKGRREQGRGVQAGRPVFWTAGCALQGMHWGDCRVRTKD